MSIPRRPTGLVDVVSRVGKDRVATRSRIPSFGAGATEDWHVIGTTGEPVFVGAFSNASGTTAFKLNTAGEVCLRGNLNAPASATGQVLFVLPEGYRPAQSMTFPTLRGLQGARVTVATNGEVRFSGAAASSGSLLLNGICFEAAN